jgi:hypothetical protein
MTTHDETPLPTTPETIPADPAAPALTDAERRAALRKLGALAAWTAPTLMTLGVVSARADNFGSPPRPQNFESPPRSTSTR